MKKPFKSIKLVMASVTLLTSTSFAEVDKARLEKTYTSPNGIQESCVALSKLPLGEYKKGDVEEEMRLCGLDFYSDANALCPKTWSTSPGTIVNGIDGHASSPADAEARLCKKDGVMKSLAKFKQTMNQSGTSGTFSASSIMYYHFARALDTAVTVPVGVYRSMDRDVHKNRVTLKARPAATAKMNVAGWAWMLKGENNPEAFNPTSDLFTEDRKQIYGVLLKNKGERYGVEINGTRASGWGKGQNMDFQKTPAFMALKTAAPLKESIEQGYKNAVKDPAMAKAFVQGQPSVPQMVLWMNEVSEIAILDYIFNQQDRVGNIDYIWYWSYYDQTKQDVVAKKIDDDALKATPRERMNRIPVPPELAGKNPVLIQKTVIGDNDAGGLPQYANFTKTTNMIDGAGANSPIRHLNKQTYQRVLKLARDLKNKGENYLTLEREIKPIGFNDPGSKRFNVIVQNTVNVAQILENNCKSGVLKLDLVSYKKAFKGELETTDATSCEIE